MSNPHYLIRKLVLFLILSGLASSGFAQHSAYNSNRITGSQVSMQISDIELDFANLKRDTRLSSIEFSVRESLGERVVGDLLLGYLEAEQISNPIFAGQDTAGGYIGVAITAEWYSRPAYKLLSSFNYRYVSTEAKTTDQTVEWHWHELGIRLDNRFNISNDLFTNVGVSYSAIDGVEKATGTQNSRTEFDQNDGLTGHIGLQLIIDGTGEIGLEVSAGSTQGGRIIFARFF